MKKIIIVLSGSWVLQHRTDDVLPIESLKNFGLEEFEGKLEYVSSTLTEIEFKGVDIKDYENLESKFITFFKDRYSLIDIEGVFSMSIEQIHEDRPQGRPRRPRMPLSDKDRTSDENPVKEGSLADDIEKDEGKDESQEVLNEILSLVSAEEFKNICKEIVQISPEIKKNKTFDVFSYQTYVFSVNDGYGLTTYLELFSKLLKSLKIVEEKIDDEIIEEKLPAPNGENDSCFSNINKVLGSSIKGYKQVLCIDISEWINKLSTKPFKGFLANLNKHVNNFIIVFRVPFVDKEVLNNIHFALNDLMFVREISLPPFTEAEIQQFATKEFEKYGFNLCDLAWEGFNRRIAEEKSDGKFYGINTIKKVVRELLYVKQLSNAREQKAELTVNKNDTLSICSTTSVEGVSGYEMLDKMVGGEALKNRINEIISQIELARKNSNLQAPCIHMRFVGNPGTGKTTAARIIGKILKERGVLRIGNFYEYAGRDFVGRYVGETAPKTASMCRDAYGSVLFIDEAYSLYRGDRGTNDFGREALDTLIAEMENNRSDLVVIMAGYADEIETLMKGNAGLSSRMPYLIEFPNFTREELYKIFLSMFNNSFKYESDLLPIVKNYFDNIPDEVMNSKEFSNARFVRNLFERTWAKALMRAQLNSNSVITITKGDFESAISDKEFTLIKKKKNHIGFI